MTAPNSELGPLRSFRADQVPQLGRQVYLDYARRGLLLRSAREAILDFLPSLERGSMDLEQQARIRESCRARLARIVGHAPQQIALTANTTTAITLLAQSVPWKAGDRVLLAPDEVESNRLPWYALESRGVIVDQLPSRAGRLDLEDLSRACRRAPPRWFSLSLVSLVSGQRRAVQEAKSIVSACGGRVCVDVAQALGILRIRDDLSGVDAVVGCARKWLCGVPGLGFLILGAGGAGLVPVSAGMRSFDAAGVRHAGALEWEGGVEPLLAVVGLEATLRAREALAEELVERAALGHARMLRDRLASLVAALPEDEVSPIVWVRSSAAIARELAAQGVVVRPQEGRVRVSAHAWSTAAEVERAAALLAQKSAG